MARKQEKQARGIGRLRGAAKAVKQLFTRGRHNASEAESTQSTQSGIASASSSGHDAAPRPSRVTRQSDIPLDLIGNAYTPSATSSKASFRSDGSDHQSDQEFALGVSDERWNDEDRFTNKSGDPRIGTHRRTYEPVGTRADERD
jgi:hypothetical protein